MRKLFFLHSEIVNTTICLIILVIFLCTQSEKVFAQLPDATEQRQIIHPLAKSNSVELHPAPISAFTLNSNGTLSVTRGSISTLKYPERDVIELLKNENVRLELELTEKQAKAIDKLIDEIDELVRNSLKHNFFNGSFPEMAVKRLANLGDELGGMLLSHQSNRIEELKFRAFIRKNGLYSTLFYSEFSDKFKLTAPEKRAVFQAGHSIAKEQLQSTANFREEAIKKLTDCLTDDQAEKLKQHFGEGMNLPLDIFLYHLNEALHRSDAEAISVKKSTQDKQEGYEGLLTSPHYEMEVDGRLKLSNPRKKIGIELIHFVLHGDFQNQLDLSVEQKQELQDRYDVLQEKIFAARPTSDMSREELEEFMKRTKGVVRALNGQAIPTVESILVPAQIETLKKQCEMIGIQRTGFFDSLVNGKLAAILDVTDSQKTKLRNAAQKIVDDYSKKSIKIESEVLEQLASSLNEESGELFRELLGKRIRHSPANIEVFLTFLMQNSY